MDKKSRVAAALGIVGGAALLTADLLSKRGRQVVRINQEMPAAAPEVIDLIKQVEREPELIPIISSVSVQSRSDSDVIYTVRASPPLPASVRYRKWWDDAVPSIHWESLCGTLGFHHQGQIQFTAANGRSIAHLRSEHWVTAPAIGRVVTPISAPVIRTELAAWLRNIAEELARR